MFRFYFILEYFNLSTCWVQSDVFGIKSKGLARSGKLDYLGRKFWKT